MIFQGPQRLGTLLERLLIRLVVITSLFLSRVRARRLFPYSTEDVDLLVAAGNAGWQLIEYQEIERSAKEFFTPNKVKTVSLANRNELAKIVKPIILASRPRYFFYDPRSGSDGPVRGLLQAIRLALACAIVGTTPIAWLTDFPIANWRRQCAVMTAVAGRTLTLMDRNLVLPHYPHVRIDGPCLMPISATTLEKLALIDTETGPHRTGARFIGSLYPPRDSTITEIKEKLREKVLDLHITGRSLGGARTSNDEYWTTLATSQVVFTTSSQFEGNSGILQGESHFVFRYCEVLASRALLVAPFVPGSERWFIPDVHYASYTTIDEAVSAIAHYLENPSEAAEIAHRGHQRLSELVQSQAFWRVATGP